MAEPAPRRPGASFYADPVAWLVVDAVGAALRDADVREAATETGVLSVSREATKRTMLQLAAAGGRVSPMKFAGASAGSITGVACIEFGLQGPSMVLSMSPSDGRPVAQVIAKSWLAAGTCRFVVLNEHESLDSGHVVHSSVVDLAA
ncbi:MAG TPA: beta-ketoacyl synthase N-terminal-like domain-containing protein [Pseudonocardiaceae bacterium]|nr:beta-ketoacyl synthase N-terminal-like domain-containing protein [Pseudonocardiaceae bacterium]